MSAPHNRDSNNKSKPSSYHGASETAAQEIYAQIPDLMLLLQPYGRGDATQPTIPVPSGEHSDFRSTYTMPFNLKIDRFLVSELCTETNEHNQAGKSHLKLRQLGDFV